MDQQETTNRAMLAHLGLHVKSKPRSDLEKQMVKDLVTTFDEGQICNALQFPEGVSLDEALESAERTDHEIILLMKRSPIIGPINMCRMLNIPAIDKHLVLDDMKPLPTLYGKLVGDRHGITYNTIAVEDIVDQVISKVKMIIPDALYSSMVKYCKIYCLSKGVQI